MKRKFKSPRKVIESRIASTKSVQDIEYIIYARKSTDDGDNQAQSITTQIEKCMSYAKSHGLTIKARPQDFSMFENETDIYKEDNERDEEDIKVHKKYRHLFIVKERVSAKTPGVRKKRRKVIDMIDAGKIQGILSYSPDRQSRNMLEGGELIDYVDKGSVQLKYANFEFIDNSAGKMMLGIRFVFSKQYSDKLSEDVSAGNARMIEKGKALGQYKYGYIINKEKYYEPHPKYFPLMKEAFQKKLAGKTDEYIANRLNENGFYRQTKKDKEIEVNPKTLYMVRTNSFYYGEWFHGDKRTDLRETNKYYQPMITEQEHKILLERYYGTSDKLINKKRKKELDELDPFPEHSVKSPDGSTITHSAPNPLRYRSKLEKLRLTNPDATASDVVMTHQMSYRNAHKKSAYYKSNMRLDRLLKSVVYFLKKQTISNKDSFDGFVEYCKGELIRQDEIRRQEAGALQLHINRLIGKRTKLIESKHLLQEHQAERNQYAAKFEELNQEIDYYEKKKYETDIRFRNRVAELDGFSRIMKHIGVAYEKANYVQKRIFAEILGLNIVIGPQKKLTIAVSDIWEGILFHNGGHTWTGTMDLFLIREAL